MGDDEVKILLVESNDGEARHLFEMLSSFENMHPNIHHAESLLQAQELLNKEKIDLVLLDPVLPDCAGPEAVFAIKEQAFNLPLILLAAKEQEPSVQKIMELGAVDYVLKDRNIRDVLLKVTGCALTRCRLRQAASERQKLADQLAFYDVLTRLPNKRLLYHRLHEALVHAKRNTEVVAVLLINLDGLKQINGRLGYSTGDWVLKSVASRLQACTRESDTPARLGGAEFAVLLPALRKSIDAQRIARKISRKLKNPFVVGDYSLILGASVGTRTFPYDKMFSESVIKRSDFEMKRETGGKSTLAEEEDSLRTNSVMSREKSLYRAFENGELVLYYQPQVSLKGGNVNGLEALVRWQHATHGIIKPSSFMPLAETAGFITRIDEWALRSACAQIKKWQEGGSSFCPVSVNVSARHFKEKNLPQRVADALSETRLNPKFLCLEITESYAMEYIDYTLSILAALKELKVKVVLDDFGKGYSSFNYLKRFPIDKLKIDKSFVKGVPANSQDAAIFTAIVNLAHSLELQVVAEGIETKEQLEFLQKTNCDQFQGYYFCKPLPASQLSKFLKKKNRLLPVSLSA